MRNAVLPSFDVLNVLDVRIIAPARFRAVVIVEELVIGAAGGIPDPDAVGSEFAFATRQVLDGDVLVELKALAVVVDVDEGDIDHREVIVRELGGLIPDNIR